jgi:hypothetical protein
VLLDRSVALASRSLELRTIPDENLSTARADMSGKLKRVRYHRDVRWPPKLCEQIF